MSASRGFLLLETTVYLALSVAFILLLHGCVSRILASLQTASYQLRLLQQHAAVVRLLVADVRSASRSTPHGDLQNGMILTKRVDATGRLITQQVRWWLDQQGVVRRAVRKLEAGTWTTWFSSVIAQQGTYLAVQPVQNATVRYVYQTQGAMRYEESIVLYNA